MNMMVLYLHDVMVSTGTSMIHPHGTTESMITSTITIRNAMTRYMTHHLHPHPHLHHYGLKKITAEATQSKGKTNVQKAKVSLRVKGVVPNTTVHHIVTWPTNHFHLMIRIRLIMIGLIRRALPMMITTAKKSAKAGTKAKESMAKAKGTGKYRKGKCMTKVAVDSAMAKVNDVAHVQFWNGITMGQKHASTSVPSTSDRP